MNTGDRPRSAGLDMAGGGNSEAAKDAVWDRLDAEASRWMKRGIAKMGAGPDNDVDGALDCFDQALALRLRLPVAEVPRFGFGLAACWLNRADALGKLPGGAQVSLALRAQDAAIALLEALPLEQDARFPRRLAIACQNRGLALQSQGDLAGAAASFERARALLERNWRAPILDRDYLQAAVAMNLAGVRAAQAGREAEARSEIRRALSLVAGRETREVPFAEVGLKARHVFCLLLAGPLSDPAVSVLTGAVHEATDAAEDGLRLIWHWEKDGEHGFRSLACDFFRFAALVYARFQPHFLEEFLREGTAAAEVAGFAGALRAAAGEARAAAARSGGVLEAASPGNEAIRPKPE